jgi:hypothetical protein
MFAAQASRCYIIDAFDRLQQDAVVERRGVEV